MSYSNTYQYAAHKKPSIWLWIIISPVILLITGLAALGSLSVIGVVPSTEVLPGNKVPKHQVEKLIEHEILFETEKIEYFYSEGFLSILEGGNILTQDTVISYTRDGDDALSISDIAIKDIESIDIKEEGDFWTDAIYEIHETGSDDWLQLWLSVENDGHLKFMNALEQKMQNVTPDK